MIIKYLKDIVFDLDFDFQTVAAELDTSVKLMSCVEDDTGIDPRFDGFIRDLKQFNFITSYDENTDLFEYDGIKIIVHETLYCRYLAFETKHKAKIKLFLQL